MKKVLLFLFLFSLFVGLKLTCNETEIIKPPKKGYVTLTKEEYQKILDMLKPRKMEESKPPQDWIIKSADYELTINDDLRISGKAVYNVESLRNDIWVETAFQRFYKDEGFNIPPDGVVIKNDDDSVLFGTNRKGSFNLSASLHPEVIKSNLNQYEFNLVSSYAVINRLTLKYKPRIIKTNAIPLTLISSQEKDGYMIIKGMVEQDQDLRFIFEAVETAVSESSAEKRSEIESRNLYSIEPGNIRSTFNYNFIYAKKGLGRIDFIIPSGMEIMSVGGKDVITWEEKQEGNSPVLSITLDSKSQKPADILVTGETAYEGKDIKQSLPMLIPVGIDRVKGVAGVSAMDETEVTIEKKEQMQEIDISDLSGTLNPPAGTKMIFALKYVWNKQEAAPGTVVAIRQYDRAAVLAANIESAEFTTLYTYKGKSLIRAKYLIRNNIKQNLKVIPPDGFVLWSSFIEGNSVKPIVTGDNALLVPLKKSIDPSSSVSFMLELIFFGKEPDMKEDGILSFNLPECDLQIMRIGWELLLPQNYDYDDWSGNYTQIGMHEYTAVASQPKEQPEQADIYINNRNNLVNQFALNEAQQQQMNAQTERLIQQFQKKENVAKMREGRFPVKFELPRIGKQYLFRKLLLIGKAPSLTVEYELDD
jgi:hypothetical protein